jgi:hypothetical protein
MKHTQKKHFIDSVTGICGVDVVGERDSWNVMLTVTYRDKDGTEKHTDGAVRSYRGHFTSDQPAPGVCDNAPSGPQLMYAPLMANRDVARHERDQVQMHMNGGLPVYIQLEYGIEALYALRDFAWQGRTPAKYKVKARRKV